MNSETGSYRCGFVAVVGRPNVGKSTLINAILGGKISIVTSKPQTTRHRILGVDTGEKCQAIYIDTPGLHRSAKRAMNRMMNRTAVQALMDADIVLYVSEAGRIMDEDGDALARLDKVSVPVLAVVNKSDKVQPKDRLLVDLAAMSERRQFDEVIPISALRGDNVSRLKSLVNEMLPESPALFPADMLTDRSIEFRMAETIREKLTVSLQQEIPYGLTVQIENFQSTDKGADVQAVIWVERDSQKGIVVGKGGQHLKKVGRAARLELKAELGIPVHLELWVKVKQNWADNEQDLQRLGYEISHQ